MADHKLHEGTSSIKGLAWQEQWNLFLWEKMFFLNKQNIFSVPDMQHSCHAKPLLRPICKSTIKENKMYAL